MKSILFSLFMLTVNVCIMAQPFRADWTMINGDAQRSSYASMNLNFPLEVSAHYYANYGFEYGLTVTKDRLYLANNLSNTNNLLAIAIPEGDTLWRFNLSTNSGALSFIPAASDKRVLIGGQGGKGLYALDPSNGDSVWLLPVGNLYTRSPIISDERVYQISPDSLNCIDLINGNLIWTFEDKFPQIAPAADEEAVYCSSRQRIYAFDKVTGDTLWYNAAIPPTDFMSLAVDSTQLYIATTRHLYALDKDSGDLQWTVALEQEEWIQDWPSGIAIHPDYLLVKVKNESDPGNHFILFNKLSGMEINRFKGHANYTFCAPTIVNDFVVDYLNGNLYFLSLPDGALSYQLSNISTPWYPMQIVAADDRIFISGEGPLVAVVTSVSTSSSMGNSDPFDIRFVPNPVLGETILEFSLPRATNISFALFQVNGSLVATYPPVHFSSGTHMQKLDMAHLGSGYYYLKFVTEDTVCSIPFLKME